MSSKDAGPGAAAGSHADAGPRAAPEPNAGNQPADTIAAMGLPADITLLGRLSETVGVSGDEAAVRNLLRKTVKPRVDGGRIDTMGNLLVWKGRDKPGPRVLVAAHMDEIGFIIHKIDKEGFLRFHKVGGIDDRILPDMAVWVGQDKLPGVIGAKPPHLTKASERKQVAKAEDLFIDIGAKSREEAEKLAPPGTYATFATRFGTFGSGLIKGKAFDDRVGCALLAGVLAHDFPFPLYGAFTVQEEIGLRGARVAAFDIEPDVVLALEGTTCADIPPAKEHGQVTRMGQGAAISFMDATTVSSKQVVQTLIRAAEEHDIPWQWRQTTFGGTDAGALHLTGGGAPAATLSVPCRYIHSPCAVLSLADFEAARQLLQRFLEQMESTAHQWTPSDTS